MENTYTANGKTLRFTPGSAISDDIRRFWDEFSSDSPVLSGYTSGSTGTPKELRIQKTAMLYSATQTVRFFGLDAGTVALLCLPVKYIAGRMVLVRAHVAGMQVLAAEPSLNPLRGLAGAGIGFAAFTPAQVWEIMNDETTRQTLVRIPHILIGGAAVEAELEKRLLELPHTPYATYGMTETVSHIALRRLGQTVYTKISSHTRLETDAENCLRIYDPHLNPEPLQTNDVVNLMDENRFEWLGRRDFVINTGGIKLHPEQLEQKIRTLPGWADRNFFLTAETHPQYGQRPMLVVEGPEPVNPADLATVLTRVELPTRSVHVPRFVYTESGKLNRLKTLELIPLEG